MRGFAICNRP